MRVLLLGGSGFIGGAAAAALQHAGHEALTSSRAPGADVALDPTDVVAVADWVTRTRPDAIVNLVGTGLTAGTADVRDMERVNALLPAQLAAALAELPAPVLLVHAASSTERLPGEEADESEYSRTKHAGTTALIEVARRTGAPTTVLTIHNTYGPGQPMRRFVSATLAALRAGDEVVLRYPDRVRDFVFVDDVGASVVAAVERPSAGLVLAEIGTGTGRSLRSMALAIAEVAGCDPGLVRSAATPGPDAHPTTVCPVRYGTYGVCTTEVHEGLLRMTEGT